MASPAPVPLPTPTIVGPLRGLAPATFNAGPFGQIAVNGILDGLGMWTGNPVPADNTTAGEIWIRGDSVSPAYFRMEDETNRSRRDGWFLTGDVATIDNDAELIWRSSLEFVHRVAPSSAGA